jgi:hypothetical protein
MDVPGTLPKLVWCPRIWRIWWCPRISPVPPELPPCSRLFAKILFDCVGQLHIATKKLISRR